MCRVPASTHRGVAGLRRRSFPAGLRQPWGVSPERVGVLMITLGRKPGVMRSSRTASLAAARALGRGRGRSLEKRKAADFSAAFHKNYPGGVLLSHAVARAVSLAMRSLTAV